MHTFTRGAARVLRFELDRRQLHYITRFPTATMRSMIVSLRGNSIGGIRDLINPTKP